MSASHKEISNILAAIDKASGISLLGEKTDEGGVVPSNSSQLALVTVVDLEGSGYRRVGARMLVHPDGNWVGAISGGCLEGHALRIARQVMRSGNPELIVYDTRTDEAAKSLGASLGCNGVLRVWIELVTDEVIEGLQRLKEAFYGSEKKWFLTPLDHRDHSDHNDHNEPVFGRIDLKAKAENKRRVEVEANESGIASGLGVQKGHALLTRKLDFNREGIYSSKREDNPEWEQVMIESITPVIRLQIYGGGYDARPLTELGHQLGWQVTVTDDCAAKSIPSRFPKADRVVHLKREVAVTTLDPDEFTAVVLLSHNYPYDKHILNDLLTRDLTYIGILGPKKRFLRMNDEIGGKLSNRPEIHAPIGLDIGGETPFEIALAIVAEIKAVFAGRRAGMLKDRKGTIHSRDNQAGIGEVPNLRNSNVSQGEERGKEDLQPSVF